MDGSEGCVFFGVLDLCAQRGKFSRVDLMFPMRLPFSSGSFQFAILNSQKV